MSFITEAIKHRGTTHANFEANNPSSLPIDVPTIDIGGVQHEIPQPFFPNQFLDANFIIDSEPIRPTDLNPNDPVSVRAWAMYNEENSQWLRQTPLRQAKAVFEEAEREKLTNATKISQKTRRDILKIGSAAVIVPPLALAGYAFFPRSGEVASDEGNASSNLPNEASLPQDNTESSNTNEIDEKAPSSELDITFSGWRGIGQFQRLKEIAYQLSIEGKKKTYRVIYDNSFTEPAQEIVIDPLAPVHITFSNGITLNNDPDTKKPTEYQFAFFPTLGDDIAKLETTTEDLSTHEKTSTPEEILVPQTQGVKYEYQFEDDISIDVISENGLNNIDKIANYAYDFSRFGSKIRHVRLSPNTPTMKWTSIDDRGSGITLDENKFNNIKNRFYDQGFIDFGKIALLEIYEEAKDVSVDSVAKFKTAFDKLQADHQRRLQAGANGNAAPVRADYYKVVQLIKEGNQNTNPNSFHPYTEPEAYYADLGITLKENWNGFRDYINEKMELGEMLPEGRDMINETASLYINTLFKINGDNTVGIVPMLGSTWDELKEFIDYERWAGEHTLSFPTE